MEVVGAEAGKSVPLWPNFGIVAGMRRTEHWQGGRMTGVGKYGNRPQVDCVQERWPDGGEFWVSGQGYLSISENGHAMI